MYNQTSTKAEKASLDIKDLIITGVFGAILLICGGIGGSIFAITPTLTFYYPMGAAVLAGPVYLLYLAKVPKRGGITIIGIVVGVLCLITGMHWGMALGSVVCSFVADMVAGMSHYKSKKMNVIAYIIYSYGSMGTYLVFFIDPKGWASTMLGNGTTQDYIDQMNQTANITILLIMIIGTAVIALLSGLIGSKLLKKQFKKAGITE